MSRCASSSKRASCHGWTPITPVTQPTDGLTRDSSATASRNSTSSTSPPPHRAGCRARRNPPSRRSFHVGVRQPPQLVALGERGGQLGRQVSCVLGEVDHDETASPSSLRVAAVTVREAAGGVRCSAGHARRPARGIPQIGPPRPLGGERILDDAAPSRRGPSSGATPGRTRATSRGRRPTGRRSRRTPPTPSAWPAPSARPASSTPTKASQPSTSNASKTKGSSIAWNAPRSSAGRRACQSNW